MSIATEISRLQTAKADIKTAIEAKGVTVPSNATLDTYDTYVSQIPSGGTNYLELYAKKGLTGAITSAQLGTNIGSNMPEYFLFTQANITSVDLTGTGVTKISSQFCQHCTNLTSITVPNTITEIGSNFCQDTKIASFTIPSTVTKIGNYFLGVTNITSLIIPSTVTSLGSDCASSMTTLETVTYNAPIAALPNAFCAYDTNLALVDLNGSVSSMGRYCFSNGSTTNTNLLEIVLRNTNSIVTLPNAIGATSTNSAFRNRRNIKIYVPSALKASYEADANWAAGVTAGYLTIVALEGSDYE